MGIYWASPTGSLGHVLRGKVSGFSRQSCVKSQQWLLQALHMQGKLREADEELQKLVHMHATFSPDPNSVSLLLLQLHLPRWELCKLGVSRAAEDHMARL
jgi:hypothetical protein